MEELVSPPIARFIVFEKESRYLKIECRENKLLQKVTLKCITVCLLWLVKVLITTVHLLTTPKSGRVYSSYRLDIPFVATIKLSWGNLRSCSHPIEFLTSKLSWRKEFTKLSFMNNRIGASHTPIVLDINLFKTKYSEREIRSVNIFTRLPNCFVSLVSNVIAAEFFIMTLNICN